MKRNYVLDFLASIKIKTVGTLELKILQYDDIVTLSLLISGKIDQDELVRAFKDLGIEIDFKEAKKLLKR